MTVVETSREIEAPPEAVWAFISDLERVPEWVVFTDEMLETSSEEPGVGTEYRELGGPGPIEDESTWRITAFDPPHRQVHEGDLGAMEVRLTMEVEPTARGSRLTHRVDLSVLPRVRPVGWLLEHLVVKHVMRRGLEDSQAQAEAIVEAEAGAADEAAP